MPNNSIFPTMNLLSSILPLRTLAPYLISKLLNKFSSCFTTSFNLRYDSLSINALSKSNGSLAQNEFITFGYE